MSMLFKGQTQIAVSDLLKPLQEWQVNPRCLKSIEYIHNKKIKGKREQVSEQEMKNIDERIRSDIHKYKENNKNITQHN